MMKSIKQIAKEYNGRSRACKKCPYLKCCTPQLHDICSNAFVEGFIKGYNNHKKQLKQNNHERKY